jgi:hypothetical protein
MRTLRLDRRTLIRGGGSIALALPWLEAMERGARAATTTPARFLAVFQPGGTVRARYTPTGTETEFTLGPILAPLEPLQDRLLVLDGLDLKSAVGEQHQAGIVALLTGTPQRDDHGGYAGGPSIDQVIATRISAGKKRKASLQMAVRWATGRSKGRLSPINALSFEDNGMFSPIPPRLDPVQIFDDLFGTAGPDTGLAARIARRKSILDLVSRRYATLSARLGATDRQKLEQHLTKIREIEQGLSIAAPATPAGACHAPVKVDTSDYNPRTGLQSSDTGSIVDSQTDAAIPKVGKYMMDMLVTALACDMTAVATLQWSDTEAKHTFPWLGLDEHHHFYQHDGGFRPKECEQIGVWYSQQHLYLLQQMAGADMGGHSLLDETVVLFGSELQEPPSHQKNNMPLVLAGGGGALRTGRWLKFGGRSHNDLLVALLNVYGDARRTFGDPSFCAGPLPGLT